MIVLPLSPTRLRTLGVIVIILVVASLAILLWPRPPHGGLSRTDAIRVAWEHVQAGAVGVSGSEVRHNFDSGFGLPVHSWAWVITFNGQWHLLCQGHGGGCDPTSEWVAIDYYSGDWIASQHAYPTGR
ncbi:MAG: hypothetical protein E6J25_06845 [Chloroflexi bacterium]|nr:MAG: hypothetical protein E6J25_06845 [Chloroflexota bacterium]TME54624.1 MAG: hypothetical protein E6I60_07565 [Chloroflexota bacterium]